MYYLQRDECRRCFPSPPLPICGFLNATTVLAEASALEFSAWVCLNVIRLAAIQRVCTTENGYHSLLAFREGVWAEWTAIK